MFKSRVALAATLSGNYGIYSGFELLEHEPIPGKEEYLNSEKYEIKVARLEQAGQHQELHRPAQLACRKSNPALLQTSNLRFAQVDDGDVIGFVKESPAGDNAVAVAIALDRRVRGNSGSTSAISRSVRRTTRGRVAAIENLITGEQHTLEWGGVRLRIDPEQDPALLFRCSREGMP